MSIDNAQYGQAEEMLRRFEDLVPTVVRDSRFRVGIAESRANGIFSYVSLSEDEAKVGENELPDRYIKVIKIGSDQFRLFFVGFFITYGPGIPAGFHPHDLSADQLDEKIIWVFERWLDLSEKIVQEIALKQKIVKKEEQRLNDLIHGPKSLPL